MCFDCKPASSGQYDWNRNRDYCCGTVVVVGMVRGARMGNALGVVGTTVGAVAGGILNLLWGVTSGGLLGAQAGKLIDENVIGLYHCPKCHLRFKA